MIVFSYVCNFCGNQTDIPLECEEDKWSRDKTKVLDCKSYGISIDMRCLEIKSYEWYRNRSSKEKEKEFTFCSKECVVEFIKRNLEESGKVKKT